MREKFIKVFESTVSIGFSTPEKAQIKVLSKWEGKAGTIWPSFIPSRNDKMELFSISPEYFSKLLLKDCADIARANHFFLPNAIGLVFLEKLDIVRDFIPLGAFVLGIDDVNCLNYEKNSGHLVPVLFKEKTGVYLYRTLPWNSHLDHDEYLLFFKKT